MADPADSPPSLTVFYGGTFDPVHHGHLGVARHARDLLQADIRLMPAGDPPHRQAPGAAAAHRARMLDLAVEHEPGLAVDRRELARAKPSYTVETMREVRRELGDAAPVALLIGADSLLGLPGWKEWTALFGLAHFIVAARPGAPIASSLPPALQETLGGRWTESAVELRQRPAGLVLAMRQPLLPQSATAVRQGIATGTGWRDQVPPPVADYITRHGLYATGAAR